MRSSRVADARIGAAESKHTEIAVLLLHQQEAQQTDGQTRHSTAASQHAVIMKWHGLHPSLWSQRPGAAFSQQNALSVRLGQRV